MKALQQGTSLTTKVLHKGNIVVGTKGKKRAYWFYNIVESVEKKKKNLFPFSRFPLLFMKRK